MSNRISAWKWALACTLLAAACGGDDKSNGQTSTAGGTSAGTATDTGGAAAGSDAAGGSVPETSGAPASGGSATSSGNAAGAAGDSGLAGAAGSGAGPIGPANLVFILADDLAWNLVEHMPNVRKMQKAGVTFANYFVTDSLCCPSRTSMFTGKYPHNSGVFTNTGDDGGYATYLRLGNDPQTFAVALQQAGYRTAMLGKFLNGYDPSLNQASLGWSQWDVAGNGYPEFNYDLNQDGTVVSYGAKPADYLTDVVSGIAQSFVGAKSKKPFLIEVATFAPHAPYTPAPRHANLFPNLTYPTTPAFNAPPSATDPAWLQALPPLTKKELANIDVIFRKRVQAVQAVDEMIGALLAQLKMSGHDRDTYVFFASDNGYHMGERLQRPGKQTAFDTDIRVPLIVVGPGVPAGVTLQQIAQNIDLCPTFSELAQTSPPAKANGHSLVSLLHGEPVADWRNAALIEHHDALFDANDPDAETGTLKTPPTYNALRTADTVYVEYVTDETEYHDHQTDPYELHNTAADLPAGDVKKLHDAISAIKTCKTSDECWVAQHLAP